MPVIAVLSVGGETLLEDEFLSHMSLMQVARRAAVALGCRQCWIVRDGVELPESGTIGALGFAESSVVTAVAVHRIRIHASRSSSMFLGIIFDMFPRVEKTTHFL